MLVCSPITHLSHAEVKHVGIAVMDDQKAERWYRYRFIQILHEEQAWHVQSAHLNITSVSEICGESDHQHASSAIRMLSAPAV